MAVHGTHTQLLYVHTPSVSYLFGHKDTAPLTLTCTNHIDSMFSVTVKTYNNMNISLTNLTFMDNTFFNNHECICKYFTTSVHAFESCGIKQINEFVLYI